MKILIATPLYPPDIAMPAPYVKELARRLSGKHSVTVVVYGRLPEKVSGVSFVCIDKRLPLPLRLLHFNFTLFKEALGANIIYTENGASVELPAGIVALFTRRPLIIHLGDQIANKKIEKSMFLKYVNRFALWCVCKVVKESPLPRPEILPFKPTPQSEFDEYEKSWKEHIYTLENLFQTCLK